MNLVALYGPTVTLKELCKLLKFSRSSYYTYINEVDGNPHYKENFPRAMAGYSRNRFVTQDVESYLLTFGVNNCEK